MTASSPTKNSGGVVNNASGTVTGAAAAVTITLGFIPQSVEVYNETDVILWKKFPTQAAANCIKIVATAVMTNDTGSAIVINTDGTVTLSATLAASGKVLHYNCN